MDELKWRFPAANHGEKKFINPDAFTKGFLEFEDMSEIK